MHTKLKVSGIGIALVYSDRKTKYKTEAQRILQSTQYLHLYLLLSDGNHANAKSKVKRKEIVASRRVPVTIGDDKGGFDLVATTLWQTACNNSVLYRVNYFRHMRGDVTALGCKS